MGYFAAPSRQLRFVVQPTSVRYPDYFSPSGLFFETPLVGEPFWDVIVDITIAIGTLIWHF